VAGEGEIVMKGWLRSLALLLAVATPVVANATGVRTWNVCGGNNFALCASVQVSVTRNAFGQHFVTMTIKNLSGTNGTHGGTILTAIGLDNVVPSSVNVVRGSLRVTGPCLSRSTGCDFSPFWQLQNDRAVGGGLKVDLMPSTFLGPLFGIASRCGVSQGQTLLPQLMLITSCGAGPGTVRLSFRVTQDFDITQSGDLYVRGVNGFYPTHCVTGGPMTNCFQVPASVVPEPSTIALLASGLMSLVGVGFVRRRKAKSPET
jgi:hypothetical protein